MQLLEKRISTSRLRSMVFGEPKSQFKQVSSNNKKTLDKTEVELSSISSLDIEDNNDKILSSKTGGRLSYSDYKQVNTVNIKHSKLQVGSLCPMECGGKLWSSMPGNIVKITGQGFANVTNYNLEKLRCSLCGYYTLASLPDGICSDKHDARFKSQLCVLKYYLGLPFYRLESYQKMLGAPISDATQWHLVEQVADCANPVFNKLLDIAAQGHLVHLDDTYVKILSSMKDNKRKDKGQRCGTFTTGIISYVNDKAIYLYFTGNNHAGDNMQELLDKRVNINSKILYMCDALSRNIPKNHDVTIIHCLAHARRKFSEIERFYTKECEFVLGTISKVYKIDAKAKYHNLSDDERLLLHKRHSKPLMDKLYEWLNNQIHDNIIESNGSLGKAIKYSLKHWHQLTQFLRIPGAPLDNNVVEAALKIPIRIRKNSMFFRTNHGAFVGSMLLSIIQTCNAADINPVEYLTALQENKELVFKEPGCWLPWNYRNQSAQSANAV